MGEVQWVSAEPALPLPADCERLAAAVRRALAELSEHYQHVEQKFDDAVWVSNRVAELLPIEPNDKQSLLEMEDPLARLTALLAMTPE
jgi:Lon protease-like protein